MKEYSLAAFYDPLLNPFLKGIRYKILDIVREYKPGSILDICCGTGYQVKLLQKHGFNATGIDISDQMLAVSKSGRPIANCLKQDATSLDFPDASFDLVMITLGLHEKNLSDSYRILLEMERTVRSGGYIIIADYSLNAKTSSLSKYLIHFIEYLSRGDHYKNFREYLVSGGLTRLVSNFSFTRINDHFFFGRGIILSLFRKQ